MKMVDTSTFYTYVVSACGKSDERASLEKDVKNYKRK